MVRCTKCGRENVDDAKYCVNCGADLERMERSDRRVRDECFGLPHGGAIVGIFIGTMIILWALIQLLHLEIDFGPFAVLIIGILIVAGAIYGLTRKRYR